MPKSNYDIAPEPAVAEIRYVSTGMFQSNDKEVREFIEKHMGAGVEEQTTAPPIFKIPNREGGYSRLSVGQWIRYRDGYLEVTDE